MATIDIYNLSGAKVGTFDLADEIFGAVNEDLIWEAVKHYRAGQHRGTHATKARWQVSGSGKKLWKQKGTGRARIGSIRSPLCVPAQEAVGSSAFSAGGEVCRWQADHCECV
jgi:large subunit ribosomal protein L4